MSNLRPSPPRAGVLRLLGRVGFLGYRTGLTVDPGLFLGWNTDV